MTVSEFVASVSGFERLNFTEKIKRYCWYLTSHAGKHRFSASDIAKCFDDSLCSKPSSIGPFLKSLTDQKPAFLHRRGNVYELSRQAIIKLEAKLGQRATTVAVHSLLQTLPSRISILSERTYLEEALICFRNGAFRATVVMTWNVAYDHLCNLILNAHLAHFNSQLPKSYPKADIQAVAVRDDFECLKESQVLQVAKSANVISGSVHKIMKEKLDRRNIAAHPSGVIITQLTAEDFVVDLIQNVVLKL
ncbi:hypothetical protein [Schlesneria paludicola]|uniref:hypothetical protein n=1 Tax=Schlesneria paludicola TaxID=360056 RepID=UPI00029B171E|nr:hypothetical protein [Schlesneria paludicola]